MRRCLRILSNGLVFRVFFSGPCFLRFFLPTRPQDFSRRRPRYTYVRMRVNEEKEDFFYWVLRTDCCEMRDVSGNEIERKESIIYTLGYLRGKVSNAPGEGGSGKAGGGVDLHDDGKVVIAVGEKRKSRATIQTDRNFEWEYEKKGKFNKSSGIVSHFAGKPPSFFFLSRCSLDNVTIYIEFKTSAVSTFPNEIFIKKNSPDLPQELKRL